MPLASLFYRLFHILLCSQIRTIRLIAGAKVMRINENANFFCINLLLSATRLFFCIISDFSI